MDANCTIHSQAIIAATGKMEIGFLGEGDRWYRHPAKAKQFTEGEALLKVEEWHRYYMNDNSPNFSPAWALFITKLIVKGEKK